MDAFEFRLCDDEGVVSEKLVDPPNLFDAKLTWLQQHNNLRARSGLEPTKEPFSCTGGAHLAGLEIRCTSKAHQYPKGVVLFHDAKGVIVPAQGADGVLYFVVGNVSGSIDATLIGQTATASSTWTLP